MTGLKPVLQLDPGRVGAREAAGGKAEALRLRPYCFFKALTSIHRPAHYPFGPSLSKDSH